MRKPMLQVFVHLVWATWDRTPTLVPTARRVAYRTIESVCRDLHCPVLALGGTADHVHLLVKLPATLCIADLVKRVKGSSSRAVEESIPDPDAFRWQGSYGAISVSPSTVPAVQRYIAGQEEHHRTDELDVLFEETFEYLDAEDEAPSVQNASA